MHAECFLNKNKINLNEIEGLIDVRWDDIASINLK